jgi:hypothetical protein
MEWLIVIGILGYFFWDIILDILNSIFQSRSSGYRKKSTKTFTDERGYKRFKDSGTPVHRWMASRKLGRELYPGEVVHHKNRDKADNSPENLHVFRNQAEHDRIHKIDAKRHGKKASYQGFDEHED